MLSNTTTRDTYQIVLHPSICHFPFVNLPQLAFLYILESLGGSFGIKITCMAKHSKGGQAASRLSTRKSPSHTTDDTTATVESDIRDVEPKSIFAEIAKMSATLQGVAADTATIKVTTTELKSAVNSIHERLEEMEVRISKLEDTADMLVSNNDGRDIKVEMLQYSNVRLVGLKEMYGTNGTMEACV